MTGASNPLNGADAGFTSAPAFVDIDNDGDFDMFSGEYFGTFVYWENTGTASSPTFVLRTGGANPLNGQDAGFNSTPSFVDIDNDGDFDMFSGEYYGSFVYYENTGSAASPTFVLRTGGANPLNGFDIGFSSSPEFVDIDNDGDFDMFSGEFYGTFLYFENTGSAASATFVQRTGALNPLNGEDVGFLSDPSFLDFDGDGDFDAFSPEFYGTFDYFENTGTAGSPTMTLRNASNNPLNGEDAGTYINADFVDIDNDGDPDMFAGLNNGLFQYYELATVTIAAAFDEVTGASNPLNGEDIGNRSAPAFVDIDNDGDLDMFSGEGVGNVNYFENTGTSSAPTFVQRTGGANPMNGFDVGNRSTPAMVDIDNDGDFDMFVGEGTGNFNFFQNTGTVSAPTFTFTSGASNPLNGVDIGSRSAPFFVDIDNDGDFDMFAGELDGNINYFENTGTASSATFVQRTGAANPLNGEDVGSTSVPAFVDLDGDGDFDIFVGEYDGIFNYYENTGSAASPTFVLTTGVNNPLNSVDVGFISKPTFADIDADGDFDMFAGEYTGNFNFFENICPASVLPIELVFFTAEADDLTVLLKWQTASEINNDFFTIERSANAFDWEIVEIIPAPEGDSFELLDYQTVDDRPIFGRSFYRLKQTDFDGQFSYSDIVSVTVTPPIGTINLFPNPVPDYLKYNVTTNSSAQKAQLLIYDLTGKLVLSREDNLFEGFNTLEVDLSYLRPGTYVAKVFVNDGNFLTKKILKD